MFLFSVTFGFLSHPYIWERAADSVYYVSRFFTYVTSCCHFFPLVYCGRSLGSVPDRGPFQLSLPNRNQLRFALYLNSKKKKKKKKLRYLNNYRNCLKNRTI